jgi:hypothetical protein
MQKDFAAKGPIALLIGELGKLEVSNDNELSINLVDCVLQRGALIVTKKTGVCDSLEALVNEFVLILVVEGQRNDFVDRHGCEST